MIGPLLVTACDTGSANAFAPMLKAFPHPYTLFAQDKAARVFDRWDIPYQLVSPPLWNELLLLGTNILSEQHPVAVLTGTSWGATVDKALTLAARDRGLLCAALVEHWDLYRERFSVVSKGMITEPDKFLPDRIWVNDAIAKAEAVEAGLPIDGIEVVGQPHLEHQIAILQARTECRRDDAIVFISERVGEDFPLGSPLFRGFDEFAVLDALLRVASLSNSKILIKLHPQEAYYKYGKYLEPELGSRVQVLGEVNNADLIMSAGRIVGMYSMLLLEAALVRNDVISFMPGGDPQIFIGNRLGATHSATTTDELELLLNDRGGERDLPDPAATPFGRRFLGSSKRMIAAAERLI